MKKYLLFLFLLQCLSVTTLFSKNIYVSPGGSDANDGSIGSPYATIQYAVNNTVAGDYVYLRGGSFTINATIKIAATNNGTSTNPIRLWAYPGEKPFLNYSTQPYASAQRGILLTANYWYIKGLEIAYAGDNGIKVEGNNNTIELCVLHHNGDTGIQLGFAHETVNPGGTLCAYNQIINCDSYLNFDFDSKGGDADGFACKMHNGKGNIFKGCRAWSNSDDGWDLYETDWPVEILNCITWHNGDQKQFDSIYLAKMGTKMSSYSGNGNGFKLGGNGTGGSSEGTHIVKNCVAFDNNYRSKKGFDQNSHKGGVLVHNCTSFGNGYNYMFEDNANSGATNEFKNNISFAPKGSLAFEFAAGTVLQNNSWNLAVTATAGDFLDTTAATAKAQRKADGSLPDNNFARLVAGSDLIDQGINVNLPFNGAAPDLGAYEFNGITTPVTYSLSTTVVGQGSVTPSNGSYTSGTTVNIQATPASGWKFDGWSGAATGTTNPLTLVMNSNKTLTASFSLIITNTTYTLTTITTGSGTISLSPATGPYVANTIVTATATPASGFKFDGWSGALTGTTNPATITMNANKTLTATFSPITTACTWITYQLENGRWNTGTITETKNTGYTGTAYVNTNNAIGSWFEITVTTTNAGTHNMNIRYANIGAADRPVSVSVNGIVSIPSLSMPSTGAWTTWAQTNFNALLLAGTNTIRFTALTSTGAANADKLDVCQNGTQAVTAKQINGNTAAAITENATTADMILYQNHPNPSIQTTTIDLWLKKQKHVIITLYSTQGYPLQIIADKNFDAGYNHINFNTQHLKPGVYIYTVRNGITIQKHKMTIK